MKIQELRLVGIRCFEDTGEILCDAKCNIFVGKNNAGKSSILKAITALQGFFFDGADVRPRFGHPSFTTVRFVEIAKSDTINIGRSSDEHTVKVGMLLAGDISPPNSERIYKISISQPIFPSGRPQHTIVPFLARRKAIQFSQDISLATQQIVTGTLGSLYGRIDLLATAGHPDHNRFLNAVKEIIGIEITTKASPSGKEAGFYFNRDTFVTLDRMGDGVTEMAALIVELCTEQNKIFVLEEPETNLHPRGLKALLAMIREASENNQFFIATHSNVVVRELGAVNEGKVFRVFRDGGAVTSPSKIEEVGQSPVAHMELLRELGYEFADFQLYDAWLFLEESSAERVIQDILVPFFAPNLLGKLRTYSASGAANLEPSVSEFQRLVVFIHLQPVYENRLWIRVDGDNAGKEAIDNIRRKFSQLDADKAGVFERAQFELYYPRQFDDRVGQVLAVQDKQVKRKQKLELLQEVLAWTSSNKEEALVAWEKSAGEVINFLQSIENTVNSA